MSCRCTTVVVLLAGLCVIVELSLYALWMGQEKATGEYRAPQPLLSSLHRAGSVSRSKQASSVRRSGNKAANQETLAAEKPNLVKTPKSTAAPRAPQGLQHEGQNCFNMCAKERKLHGMAGGAQGPCTFCGTGYCTAIAGRTGKGYVCMPRPNLDQQERINQQVQEIQVRGKKKENTVKRSIQEKQAALKAEQDRLEHEAETLRAEAFKDVLPDTTNSPWGKRKPVDTPLDTDNIGDREVRRYYVASIFNSGSNLAHKQVTSRCGSTRVGAHVWDYFRGRLDFRRIPRVCAVIMVSDRHG